MEIIKKSSPNFDERRFENPARGIDMLILHYTGMETGEAALERLCDGEAKVSSHYLVEEDGRIFQLVEEDKRAWHAGVSFWAGDRDINSQSIGIEIVNGGHDFGLPGFPEAQVEAVVMLCQDILQRHTIPDWRVVGHSDIAPARKQDPGERFPWETLALAGIGFWPQITTSEDDYKTLAKPGDSGKHIREWRFLLQCCGYEIRPEEVFDEAMQLVVTAFQRRFRPNLITGEIDGQTLALISAVFFHIRTQLEMLEHSQS